MPETGDDIRAHLESQIGDLKKEVTKLGKSVASRAAGVMDEAGGLYDANKGRANEVIRQMREQANVAVNEAREKPMTVATLGLVGLAAGLILGGMLFTRRR